MKLKMNVAGATLVSALAFAPVSYGQATAGCPTGRLLDVQESSDYIPTTSVGRVYRSGKAWTTVDMPSARRQTTYTVKVALNGMVYTARSNGDFRGYNPSRMVVGDDVEACVETNRLVITRHDGKTYKPTITRREREQPAAGR
jgi:hypothetical protein